MSVRGILLKFSVDRPDTSGILNLLDLVMNCISIRISIPRNLRLRSIYFSPTPQELLDNIHTICPSASLLYLRQTKILAKLTNSTSNEIQRERQSGGNRMNWYRATCHLASSLLTSENVVSKFISQYSQILRPLFQFRSRTQLQQQEVYKSFPRQVERSGLPQKLPISLTRRERLMPWKSTSE